MPGEEIFGVFSDFDPAEHQREAEERWGGTDASTEANRRVAGHTSQDWITLRIEADTIDTQLLELMTAGIPAGSTEATVLVERHRKHITKWFYDCTPEIHAGLGRMYVSDHRFKKNIDKKGDGLAMYLSEAIAASHGQT
jgi:hypothetical protein